MLISFWIITCCNGEAVEISVFDAHGLSFGDSFIARVLSGAKTFNRESFAGIRVNERYDNFNGDEIFEVAFSGSDLLFAQNVGNNDRSEAVFCKRGIDFFEHVSSGGVFVLVKLVGAVFSDVRAIAHDFDEFFGNALHE